MPANFFAPAESKLLDIWEYTLEKWGEEQADHYLRNLINRIHDLPQERHHWRPIADKSLPGIWFIRHKSHYIFFRELGPDVIGVITILHEMMDLPARIRDDAGQVRDTQNPNSF